MTQVVEHFLASPRPRVDPQYQKKKKKKKKKKSAPSIQILRCSVDMALSQNATSQR
jgi:hypothetical protein